MSTFASRLRVHADYHAGGNYQTTTDLLYDAADEIESLHRLLATCEALAIAGLRKATQDQL